jgi:hypothetical protein
MEFIENLLSDQRGVAADAMEKFVKEAFYLPVGVELNASGCRENHNMLRVPWDR